MVQKATKLDAAPETRSLIHQGTVNNQLLPLLTQADEKGVVILDQPSLTIAWPTEPGQLPDNTMVFARGTVITRLPLSDPRVFVFTIEGKAAVTDGQDNELSLTIHAADGQAWVPPQS